MAEVTRVPIQPIKEGSLVKLWLGVILAVVLGGAAAWAAVPKGFNIDTLVAGNGKTAEIGDVAFVKYSGRFASSGEEFDNTDDFGWPVPGFLPDGAPFQVIEGATVPGFFEALQKIEVGGKYEVYIPAEMGYGEEDRMDPQTGEVSIPGGSDLIFEIEVVDILSQTEAEQRLMAMQAAMQQLAPEGAAQPPLP